MVFSKLLNQDAIRLVNVHGFWLICLHERNTEQRRMKLATRISMRKLYKKIGGSGNAISQQLNKCIA